MFARKEALLSSNSYILVPQQGMLFIFCTHSLLNLMRWLIMQYGGDSTYHHTTHNFMDIQIKTIYNLT